MIDFTDQVAVVTGAGRGLGRLYALELARRGASVVVNDIGGSMQGEGADASVAAAVVDEITQLGGSAVASHESVASPEGGAAIVEHALHSFGRLDAVISNAGIYEMLPFEQISPAQWRRMLEVHLDGAFYLCQPAFTAMREQQYGRIVLIASNIGAFGLEHAVHYAAAKGGIIGLTNSLADAGASHGVGVNAVLPIGRTRMMTDSLDGEHDVNPVQERLFAAATAERVVPMTVFLASRACEVSHQYFSAAGGRFARTFIGLGEGWLADGDADPTVEDIASHMDEIGATEPFQIPHSVSDEMVSLLGQLGII